MLQETFNHIHPITAEGLIRDVQQGLASTSRLVASVQGKNVNPDLIAENSERIREIFTRLVHLTPAVLSDALIDIQDRLSGHNMYATLTKDGGSDNELLRSGPSAPYPVTSPLAPATR